jgi:acetate kinase
LDQGLKDAQIDSIDQAVTILNDIIKAGLGTSDSLAVAKVGLRVVAPSSYFQVDREFTDDVADRLKQLINVAPLHIEATLSEYQKLREAFYNAKIIAVSDSKALADKPDRACTTVYLLIMPTA